MADIKKHNHEVTEGFRSAETEVAAPENLETAAAPENNKTEPEQRPTETQHHKRPSPRHHAAPTLPRVHDPLTQKIEKILEDNVGDAYQRLSPLAKQEFKIKGEATAEKIAELLRSTHIKVKKIFQLILEWLRLLPGINRFFLEQEAKIKTDRIIAMHNHRK